MSSRTYLIFGSGAMRIGQGGEFDYSGTVCVRTLKSLGHKTVVLNPNPASIQGWEADITYYLPLVTDSVKRILGEQKIHGVFLGFGGQTALNLGIACLPIFLEHGVLICGTSPESIMATEDRELFSKRLEQHNFPQPPWIKTNSPKDALDFLKKYQKVLLRKDYSLGGSFAQITDCKEVIHRSIKLGAVYLSACLDGFIEIETEVLRDSLGTKIVVASLQNLDPLGIHTGDSVVVSSVQTLSDRVWQKIRSMALGLSETFAIVGECNLQFAYSPLTDEVYVIEMNARLSRSSALASKAVHYPIALIATRLCLGERLHKIPHPYQSSLSAVWEPAMNYVALKIPHWDWDKIGGTPWVRGPHMRSIGESLVLGKCLGEALQKTEIFLTNPSLSQSFYPTQINSLSSHKEFENAPFYLSASIKSTFLPVPRGNDQNTILVLSPGPYQIGSGIEFEWNLVWSLKTLRKLGYKVILIQPNPATVSSDPDESDRLYIESLSLPAVLQIAKLEKVDSVFVAAAAQIGARLAQGICQAGYLLFGSRLESILTCENRQRFSEFLRANVLPQPEFYQCNNQEDFLIFASLTGYPILLRPSFVLGGQGMQIVTSKKDLSGAIFPCLATRYLWDFIEYDIDCVANGSELLLYCIHEVKSQNGIHAGNSISISPPTKLSPQNQKTILEWARVLIHKLGISGGFNFQVLLHQNQLYIIELNLRFSRSFACSSLVRSQNFVEASIQAMCSKSYRIFSNPGFKTVVKTPVFSEHAMSFTEARPDIQMLATGEEVHLEELSQPGFNNLSRDFPGA